MAPRSGSASAGWRFLQKAMEKIPGTGDLGLIHSSFRSARKDEGSKIMAMPKGSAVFHGLSAMEHGQRHCLSTATGYSGHASSPRVGKAGGIMGVEGTSGRYINPFGVMSSAVDGAEVLYPPGTATRYAGSVNTGPRELAMHRFVEAPLPDSAPFREDGNYLPVDFSHESCAAARRDGRHAGAFRRDVRPSSPQRVQGRRTRLNAGVRRGIRSMRRRIWTRPCPWPALRGVAECCGGQPILEQDARHAQSLFGRDAVLRRARKP